MELTEILFITLIVSLLINLLQSMRNKDLKYWRNHWKKQYEDSNKIVTDFIESLH